MQYNYNTERPHQNLDNELISPKENEHYEELRLTREQNKGKVLYKSAKDRSLIVKKQRLGGILTIGNPLKDFLVFLLS